MDLDKLFLHCRYFMSMCLKHCKYNNYFIQTCFDIQKWLIRLTFNKFGSFWCLNGSYWSNSSTYNSSGTNDIKCLQFNKIFVKIHQLVRAAGCTNAKNLKLSYVCCKWAYRLQRGAYCVRNWISLVYIVGLDEQRDTPVFEI